MVFEGLGVDFMALVWAEPFDLYGNTAALVSTAGYTDVNVQAIVSSAAQARTGLGAMQIENGINGRVLRRALDVPASTIGQGIGFMPLAVPPVNRESTTNCLRFESAGKTMEFMVVNQANNGVCVVDRTGTIKGATIPNKLIVNSYTHIEAKGIMNAGGVVNTGSIEVRLQGQNSGSNLLVVNGVNLPNSFAYCCLGAAAGFNQAGDARFDDWLIWDGTGVDNNDFMGDRRLWTSFMNADTAFADFTPNPAGAGWSILDNVPTNDAQYVEGTAAGNISEFQKTPIGINANDVAAVVAWGRMAKSDAGVASGRLGIHSGAFVDNSAEIFPGTTFAWFQKIWERDPNGAIPWTKAAADAAFARLTRQQ